MSKVLIVTRHLENHRPVPHTIVREPVDHYDNPEDWMTSEAERRVRDFINTFVEFETAKFYYDFVNF